MAGVARRGVADRAQLLETSTTCYKKGGCLQHKFSAECVENAEALGARPIKLDGTVAVRNDHEVPRRKSSPPA
jgi:hypothetical protein